MCENKESKRIETVSFFVPCIPPKTTSQSAMRLVAIPGKGVRTFKSKKGKQAEADLLNLLKPYAPEQRLEGALSMRVAWIWPWRKSDPKRVRKLGAIPYTSRPDLDNLTKMLGDTITRLGWWLDDSQVAELEIRKALGDSPGIGIAITRIPDDG